MTTPIIYFSHGNMLKGSDRAKACLDAIQTQWPDAKIWNPANTCMKTLANAKGGWDALYDQIITRIQTSGGLMVVLENGGGHDRTIGRGVHKEVLLALQSTAVIIPVYCWRDDTFQLVDGAVLVDTDDWTHRFGACTVAPSRAASTIPTNA